MILTQDLCRVCALPSGHVEAALDYLGCHADVVTLDPHTLDDVLVSILTVGARLGCEGVAALLVGSLRARLDAVATAVAGRSRPRVAVVEWVDPPFTGGHWVPDLVTAADGVPVAGHPGRPSGPTTWQWILDERPDVVLVAPCGFHLDGASEQARVVAAALSGIAVWAIDGDGLVVRPGPRLVDGVEAIAAVLHPTVLPLPEDSVSRIA